MNKLWLIIKINIKNALNLKKFSSTPNWKKLLFGLFALYLIITIGLTLTVYTKFLYDYLLKFNLVSIMMPAIIFLIACFTTVFSLFNAKNTLFSSRDNDLLISLPISEKIVFLSRFITLYLFNLMPIFISLSVSGIYFGILTDANINYYLLLLGVVIFLPSIPTIIISLFGYLVAKFTAKFRFKNLVEIITSFTAVIMFMIVSMNIQKVLDKLVNNQEIVIKIFKYTFYPIYLLYDVFNSNDIFNLISFIGINILVVIIFVYLFSYKYYQIISNLQKGSISNIKKIVKMKQYSIQIALFKKELKRYLTSPIYVLNTSFGILIFILVAIATFFYDYNSIIKTLDLPNDTISPAFLILSMILFICSVSNTTGSSISLEGKSFWIIKTIPVHQKLIFNGKLFLNYLVVIPISLVSIIILIINLKINLLVGLLLIMLAILTTVVSAYFGLYINLLFPKLNYNNDVQIVKQSMSSMISILVPMFLVLITLMLISYIKINLTIALISIILILCIIYLIIKRLLYTDGLKKFRILN